MSGCESTPHRQRVVADPSKSTGLAAAHRTGGPGTVPNHVSRPPFGPRLRRVSGREQRVPSARGLSRRSFLALVGTVAAAWAIPKQSLVHAVTAIRSSEIVTTLTQTIRMSSTPVRGEYRTLVPADGEPYLPRLDIIRREADPARTNARRSLGYFAHLSDIHLIDAQSPARMDAMQSVAPELFTDACRPQDLLTTHVLASMVESFVHASESPVTGAPLAAAFVTGDSTDDMSSVETQWYIDLLDGGTITPNTGAADRYEGPQVWSEATYAYHPDDPTGDVYGAYGFPRLPGMIEAAIDQPVTSPGLPVPWYTVYGNHDVMYMGTFRVDPSLRSWAVGDRKAATGEALALTWANGLVNDASAFTRYVTAIAQNASILPGVRSVTSDPVRKMLERTEFMERHLDSPALPGPVGHGFTAEAVSEGRTWWATSITPWLRVFGLDTCNVTAGADGAVPETQFSWLEAELAACQQAGILVIVLSHHNSTTLENDAVPVVGQSDRLVHAEEFVAMLLRHPVCIAWVNGHTHINTIRAHRAADGSGFWEITAASCVDFPQQQQLLELVDNRDGTMSIFVTVLDHASDAQWQAGDYSANGMASLSRELSANQWVQNPGMRAGSPYDRNTELLLNAPIDLSRISDGALERHRIQAQARLLAHGGAE